MKSEFNKGQQCEQNFASLENRNSNHWLILLKEICKTSCAKFAEKKFCQEKSL